MESWIDQLERGGRKESKIYSLNASTSYLYGHMQKVAVIQAGFHSAVFVTAAADVRVRGTHDEELVEITLWQELKQHTDRLLLGDHTQQTHHVGMLQLSQHRGLL